MKSTVAGPILWNAIDSGYSVGVYSGELPATKFLEWMFLQGTEAKYIDTGVSSTGKVYATVSNEIQMRIRKYLDKKVWLFDNTFIPTKKTYEEAIILMFTVCAQRYGTKLFLVD